MAGTSNYPGALDDFSAQSPTNLGDDDSTGRTHSERHDDLEAAMEAVQGELGVDPAGPSASTVAARFVALDSAVDGKVSASLITASADLFVGAGSGSVAVLASGSAGQVLTVSGSATYGLAWLDAAGGATVEMSDTEPVSPDNGTLWVDTDSDVPTFTASAYVPNSLVANSKGALITSTGSAVAALTVGTNGHVLTADSAATNGIKWAALPSSDLALIDTVTVLASATLNVNNVFSATYQNYLIVVRLLGTGAVNCTLRLRASGSDATGSDYAVQDLVPSDTNTSPSRATGTSFRAFALGDTNHSAGTIHVFAPNSAERTQMTSFVVAGNDGVVTYLPTCQHQLATAYDGFSLTAASGTMTGVVRVYGYKGA